MITAVPSKNQIIEALFNGKNFTECISRMEPEHLRDDLRQEVILKICEQSEDKIIGLHQRGELEFYTVRIILNESRNKNNGFARKYLSKTVELSGAEVSDDSDFEQRMIREELEDYAISEIESLYWYDSELLKMYMNLGTFRAIQELTGIPHVSCFKTIKKAMATLKRRATVEIAARPKPVFSKRELSQIAGNETKNVRG